MKLPLQSCTFRLHLEKHHQDEECHREGVTLLEPALCYGKERSLWQKCLQAGSEPTVCSTYEELDYISADNIYDITGVLYRLHHQIGQWWDRLFSQNHSVVSSKTEVTPRIFFFFCLRVCQGGHLQRQQMVGKDLAGSGNLLKCLEKTLIEHGAETSSRSRCV